MKYAEWSLKISKYFYLAWNNFWAQVGRVGGNNR